jgi:hypothetical protein
VPIEGAEGTGTRFIPDAHGARTVAPVKEWDDPHRNAFGVHP